MNRPSLATTVHALTLTHPRLGVLHTDEEADIAEVLRHVDAEHRPGGAYDPDTDRWGGCTSCAQPWPCPDWIEAEHLGLLYLGRAQDRVAAHARQTLDRLAASDRTARRAA